MPVLKQLISKQLLSVRAGHDSSPWHYVKAPWFTAKRHRRVCLVVGQASAVARPGAKECICTAHAYPAFYCTPTSVLRLQSTDHRQPSSGPNSAHRQRVHTVIAADTLRSIVERLAQPGEWRRRVLFTVSLFTVNSLNSFEYDKVLWIGGVSFVHLDGQILRILLVCSVYQDSSSCKVSG